MKKLSPRALVFTALVFALVTGFSGCATYDIMPVSTNTVQLVPDQDFAKADTLVSVQAIPVQGNTVRDIVVTDSQGMIVPTTADPDSLLWTFTMPASSVSIRANVNVPARLPANSSATPVPLTKEMLLSFNRDFNVSVLTYYISDRVTLSNESMSEEYAPTETGTVRRRQRSDAETIIIPRYTPGELFTPRTNAVRRVNEGDSIYLAICFDEMNVANKLWFRENENGRFYLDYKTIDDQSVVEYGGKIYRLSFDQLPCLCIKYEEVPVQNPVTRSLRGRSPGK